MAAVVIPRHRPDETSALVTLDPLSSNGRQVKSVERVRDLGEVFTPPGTVQAMLDLLPAEMWSVHPSPTFLEPACGDGNFLVAILDRKLARVGHEGCSGRLPAGGDRDAVAFHALEALSSIYAVDISVENIVGGTPGHEVGARDRLVTLLRGWFSTTTGARLTDRSPLVRSARWIVERNVQVANMLATNADGTKSGRDEIPLVEYRWHAEHSALELATTTLGAVMTAATEETAAAASLFGAPKPTTVWSGTFNRLHEAPIVAPEMRVTSPRNGNGYRGR